MTDAVWQGLYTYPQVRRYMKEPCFTALLERGQAWIIVPKDRIAVMQGFRQQIEAVMYRLDRTAVVNILTAR